MKMTNRWFTVLLACLLCVWSLSVWALIDTENVLHTGQHDFEGPFKIDSAEVTATAAELNQLDGGSALDQAAATITSLTVEAEIDLNTATLEGTARADKSTLTSTSIGVVNKTLITFNMTKLGTTNDLDLANDDSGTGQMIFTFPAGRIYILGAAIDAVVTNTAAWEDNTSDTYAVAVGTAIGANDNALTSTECDVIASTTIDTASHTVVGTDWEADMTAGADTVFDGTATAVSLYVNAACAAGNASDTNCVGFIGSMNVFWMNLGDD